ncbi:hypothetical protein ACET3X_004722 [Alternaria dauci]|uniref:Uncharacterized protein n=1 Tax=Alternaria dauci TaxID=48095 RepID=A0ABR3UIW2_9PLEO
MEFIKFTLYLWLVLTNLVASTPLALPDFSPPPPRRPPRSEIPSASLAATMLEPSCNLVVPTAQSWMDYKDDIIEFSQTHVERFRRDPSYTTFPLYLRDQFARDLLPSSLSCDSVGDCGLTSCQMLNPELAQHDKQMAYFVFEQISGVDHLFKSQREAMREAASYIDGKIPEIVRTYSAGPRIASQLQERLNDRRRYEKLAMSLITAVGLMAGGAMALPAFGLTTSVVLPVTNLMASTYISVIGAFNAVRRDPGKISSDVEENLRSSLNEFRHAMIGNVTYGMDAIMGHGPSKPGQDLMDILRGDYFFRRDENIQQVVHESFEKMVFSTVINGAWAQERSYIVWADVPTGSCEYDARGPQESRVCLYDRPSSVYYMYALDVSREYDHGKNDMALIHSPTGYRNFIQGRNPTPYGITKEDVIRSSIFVHENKLQGALRNLDHHTISAALERGKAMGKDYGKVPGTFYLPISRNPGGEAISSVWTKHGRNYACMSGEFGWNDGSWTLAADETEDFLYHTGLMFSEDWERFCHRNGECKGADYVDLHAKLEARRKVGDPEIPKRLKHLFWKCEQDTKHGPGKPEHDYDSRPPI